MHPKLRVLAQNNCGLGLLRSSSSSSSSRSHTHAESKCVLHAVAHKALAEQTLRHLCDAAGGGAAGFRRHRPAQQGKYDSIIDFNMLPGVSAPCRVSAAELFACPACPACISARSYLQ